jgi:hypothetical protein
MTSGTQRNGCGERLPVLHGARKVGKGSREAGKQGSEREPVGAVRCTPEMHGPTEIGGFYTAEIFFRVTNSLHVLVVTPLAKTTHHTHTFAHDARMPFIFEKGPPSAELPEILFSRSTARIHHTPPST